MLGKLFSGGSVTSSAQIPLSFRVSEERSLSLLPDDDVEALQVWRYLSHHIRRYPHDLRAHVQRILLTQRDSLVDRLEGSLLDLYLALGDAGQMLKERMLEVSHDYLQEESKTLFSDWLNQQPDTRLGASWLNGSMLATGKSAVTHSLLTQQRTESDVSYASLQEEIQDYLEYGQIDLAQELLEKEILEGRSTPELRQELLTIYQHTRNKARLNELADAMVAAEIELSEQWSEARNEAEHW